MNNELPKTGYLTFDALTLRQMILDKLNQEGNFTDQNYIGSNLASYIDVISYAFHTLIYYLNQTGAEAMFTEAQLYENINKIVKLLDYNPVGFQSSTLSFRASADGALDPGTYTIPRYSYIAVNSIPFSFTEDVTFAKNNEGEESLDNFSSTHLLYQGMFVESPPYVASGDKNETVILVPESAKHEIDHFRIDVYVKEGSTWRAYQKTQSLYLEPGPVRKYEIRLNDKREYEIKFGDEINGRRLVPGDKVLVYSLQSTKPSPIGPNELKPSARLFKKNTPTLLEILGDAPYILLNQLDTLKFTNPSAATEWSVGESVEEIRQNAPSLFKTQYRAVTKGDYLSFIKSNYNRFLQDAVIFDNWDYTSLYLGYYWETLNMGDPVNAGGQRALTNHVMYSDSTHFNNIYVIGMPKFNSRTGLKFLTPAQKALIRSDLNVVKTLTSNICFLDPIYRWVTFAMPNPEETVESNINNTRLVVYRRPNTTVSAESLRFTIAKDILDFFWSPEVRKLGGTVFLPNLAQNILQTAGVDRFDVTNGKAKTNDLIFVHWNPEYSTIDHQYTSQNIQLRPFESLLLQEASIEELERRIEVH